MRASSCVVYVLWNEWWKGLGFRVLGLSPLGCGLLQEYKGPHEVKPSMGLIRDKAHTAKGFSLSIKDLGEFLFSRISCMILDRYKLIFARFFFFFNEDEHYITHIGMGIMFFLNTCLAIIV